jgi:hypothetical protein
MARIPSGSEDREIQARQGISMAIDTSGGHPAMDYAEHQRTYKGFVRGTVILTVLVLFILASMAYFLV